MNMFRMLALGLLMASCVQAQWQVNQPGASLDLEGVQGSVTDPAYTALCPGTNYSANFSSSFAGAPWDIGVTATVGVPGGAGGVVTSGGQIANLDFSAAPVWINGLTLAPTFVSSSFSLLTPSVNVSGQMFVVTPSMADGFALSALVHVELVVPQVVTMLPGPTGDDSSVAITLPSCFSSVSFAGVQYRTFYVNSNGSITFGQPRANPVPTVADFSSGPPCLAGLWTDLDPSESGDIQVLLTDAPFAQSCEVLFTNVSEDGTLGASTTSMGLRLDISAGTAFVFNYTPGANHASDSIVGLSPGNGAIDPGPAGGPTALLPFTPSMFSEFTTVQSLPGNNPNDMVYEKVCGGAPVGWTSLVFPSADPTQWLVF